MQSSRESIAFELAIQQLANQKEDLRVLRNQASISAAISGLLATAFSTLANGTAIEKFQIEPTFLWFGLEAWLVLITFAGSVAFSVLVVTARGVVNFDLSPKWILDESRSGTLDELRAELAIYAEQYFDGNEKVIEQAAKHLFFSLFFSWCQIPAWLLLLF